MRPSPGEERAEREAVDEERAARLMTPDDEDALRQRWNRIQTGFVDEPSRSVQQADELVAEVMKRITDVFSRERAKLEGHWSRQQEVSTEDLRVALQRYRSFFDRLLGMRVP